MLRLFFTLNIFLSLSAVVCWIPAVKCGEAHCQRFCNKSERFRVISHHSQFKISILPITFVNFDPFCRKRMPYAWLQRVNTESLTLEKGEPIFMSATRYASSSSYISFHKPVFERSAKTYICCASANIPLSFVVKLKIIFHIRWKSSPCANYWEILLDSRQNCSRLLYWKNAGNW